MAIERTVETDVYCDVCGEWIMGWKSNDVGVSRAWAAEYTRRRGGDGWEENRLQEVQDKRTDPDM